VRCRVCDAANARHLLRADVRDYWRCEACAVTFLEPAQLPDPATELAQYRLHRNNPEDAGYRAFLARLAEPLLDRLSPGSSGLDYGCGPGPALAAMLREAGHTMALYDPLFCDDAAVLSWQYDFITCTEVVEHFHDPFAEFARLDRLLGPGGWLALITTFQTDDDAFSGWHYRRDPTHVVFYREATFHCIARRFGWRCQSPCRNVALLQKPQ